MIASVKRTPESKQPRHCQCDCIDRLTQYETTKLQRVAPELASAAGAGSACLPGCPMNTVRSPKCGTDSRLRDSRQRWLNLSDVHVACEPTGQV